ncbi:outer membrane protein [Bartonella sp. CB189]|uniref:outer membrane protein n=1 Tax=Bartonella sp. CB189 TaxID=3112254 RepID=UPI002F964CB9
MSTKYLIAASAFTVMSSFVAQASDMLTSQKSEQIVSSITISPTFSWTGFYLGGQLNGFSSKLSAIGRDFDVPLFFHGAEDTSDMKWIPVEKKYLPKLSGFVPGLYIGANVDLGQGFILGVDADVLLVGKKGKKNSVITTQVDASVFSEVKNGNDKDEKLDAIAKDIIKKSMMGVDKSTSIPRSVFKSRKKIEENHIIFGHTFKQKWVGAARMRLGYPLGFIMPYISGGVTYGDFHDILSVSVSGVESLNDKLDDTKTMVGYTLGGGFDFAMTDNIILRAEYRYSDFGKKKFKDMFEKDVIELDYKANDFRVGVAYKF